MAACEVAIGRHVVVGAASPIPTGAVDLVLLPGEKPPALPSGVRTFAPTSLDHALYLLREAYADHGQIATLASTVVVGEPEEWRTAIEDRLAAFLPDIGNCPQDSWAGALNALRNGDRLAGRSTGMDLAAAGMVGQAAVCLGAGPSAQRYLPQLAELAGRVRLFAADSMHGACLDAGIDPDFVCFMERVPEVVPYAARGGESRATVIAPPVIDARITEAFAGRCLWWYGGDELALWLAPTVPPMSMGRSAGTLTVAAALAAGCSPIYLVGHDLSYAANGASHAAVAHPQATACQQADDSRGVTERFTIPGNAGCPVWTNQAWNSFRIDIESLIASCSGALVVNVTDYAGAVVAGAPVGCLPTPLRPRLPPVETPMGYRIDAPGALLPIIRSDCRRVRDIAAAVMRGDLPPAKASGMMAVSVWASAQTSGLFRYVFRSAYHCLTMRLHLGGDYAATTRLLALTLDAMAERMLADLEGM